MPLGQSHIPHPKKQLGGFYLPDMWTRGKDIMTTILKKYTLEIGQRCQHRMAIAIEINEECPVQEVSSVIKSALLRDTRVASYNMTFG